MNGTASALLFSVAVLSLTTAAQIPPGEAPALGLDRLTQAELAGMSLDEIRAEGLRIFSTPFNGLDGFGDGPMNPADPLSVGSRPTLQDNGMFLRVNGLDAQSCLECHSIGSNRTIPSRFTIGGVGGSSANVMARPDEIDVDASLGHGYAFFNGRFINPPFLFGSGGVELLAKEMTAELQMLKALAQNNPHTQIRLLTKGVDFGHLLYDPAVGFDVSQVVGIDPDLVVRPFGRKGMFATVRAFDVGALDFHFGMQPIERVGADVDDDGDGIANEVMIGEVSAMHVFGTNLERPYSEVTPTSHPGFYVFNRIGCGACHKPYLDTASTTLAYCFPEVESEPFANVFRTTDLTGPSGFDPNATGGVRVPLFSDLKRHNMGPGLAEATGGSLDPLFITARLWGVADTAPYLHDGRALTLTDAILQHGGAAQRSRDAFAAIPPAEQANVIEFLGKLRTPKDPSRDLGH